MPQKDRASSEAVDSEIISEKPVDQQQQQLVSNLTVASTGTQEGAVAATTQTTGTPAVAPTTQTTTATQTTGKDAAGSAEAVDGDANEKSPETPATPTVLTAPITVSIQSPTPTVSRADNIGAMPEAPFPPAPKGEESDASDADTIDDKTSEPSGRRRDDPTQIPLPSTASSEQRSDTTATTPLTAAAAAAHDNSEAQAAPGGALVDGSTGKDRQQWLLPPLQPEFEGKKCLVLDLDETLVHSSFKVCPSLSIPSPLPLATFFAY